MINGNEYAFEDVSIVADGNPLPLEGAFSIKYKTMREHKNVYGRGFKPTAMVRGKESYEASIGILQSQLEAWQRTMPKGQSLTSKTAFTITVAYAPSLTDVPTVDQILFARIPEVEKGINGDDMNMEIELPLLPGDIKYNV